MNDLQSKTLVFSSIRKQGLRMTPERCCNSVSFIVFAVSLLIYWLTADSSVSYWDCPEYVTSASLLEIGHPPGNPLWTLAMRVATIPFPQDLHAYIINLCSGLFTAGASFFICRIIFFLSYFVISARSRKFSSEESGEKTRKKEINPSLIATFVSAGGAFCFSFCDSVWFSAVEAEVYAMSVFLLSLSLWIMLKWTLDPNPDSRLRKLILIAYITGLSLGVHQLNLLSIPVFVLICLYRKRADRLPIEYVWCVLLLSLLPIIIILYGLMPGLLEWAGEFELMFVNGLELSYFSGVYVYIFCLLLIIILSIFLCYKGYKFLSLFSLFLISWFSGLFNFGGSYWWGLIGSLLFTLIMSLTKISQRTVSAFIWSLGFIIIGYSSFALIIIRGYASPPMNEASPSNIFSLASYIARDQYPSTPLIYGATPYSQPLLEEKFLNYSSIPVYERYLLKKGKPNYMPFFSNPDQIFRSGFMTPSDTFNNLKVERLGHGYLLSDYSYTRVFPPELDMWFPRITSKNISDLESYEAWSGMNIDNMKRVKISETKDSSGNFVSKMNEFGERPPVYSYRPTYLQNLKFFLSYQAYYMYLRYLLWNFIGRQNDIHSTGEIEHGNFITGVSFIDNAMLGDQTLLPPEEGHNNPGHNVYFAIPFIIGVIGIVTLSMGGRIKRRINSVIFILFLMTGFAIVVYLNQTPGEPRERDYSFLGSYLAFSLWIGLGMTFLQILFQHLIKNRIASFSFLLIVSATPPLLMASENYDDHNRHGRKETYDFARAILSNDDPSIIFTYGDNSTFPLWYASEVMKQGRDHSILDYSYLISPAYVVNMTKQGERGIKLKAQTGDILYNAYAFTRIPKDFSQPVLPLDSALDILYSQKTANPVFPASHVLIKGINKTDSLTIRLRDLTGESSFLPFRSLMLLDLISSNLNSNSPKSLYFLNGIPLSFYKPFLPFTRQALYGRVLKMGKGENTDIEDEEEISGILKLLSENSYKDHYADPLIKDQQRRQRGALVEAAKRIHEKGNLELSQKVTEQINNLFPYSLLSPGSYTVADTTYHEGLEFVKLLIDRYETTGSEIDLEEAQVTLGLVKHESEKWLPYYKSLSSSQREALSNSTLRLISIIPKINHLQERIDSLSGTHSFLLDHTGNQW